jgi:hypothetical protein
MPHKSRTWWTGVVKAMCVRHVHMPYTCIGMTTSTPPPGHAAVRYGSIADAASVCEHIQGRQPHSTCSRMLLASARVRSSKRSRSVPPSATTNTMYSCKDKLLHLRSGRRT